MYLEMGGNPIQSENGSTVRTLEACFGDVILSGHTVSSESFAGREVVYSVDDIGPMSYTYDLAGDELSYTHPAGFTISNTYNSDQQVTQVTSSVNNSTEPGTLASMTYTPWGALSTLTNGCAGSGCVQTEETYTYNNRLQPVKIELGTSSNASANDCLVYNYYSNVSSFSSCQTPPQGSGDNGDVMGVYDQDNSNTGLTHTTTYTYDGANRLLTAAATGNSTYNLTFNYDQYGNMTCVQKASTSGLCPQYSYNSNNQITNSGFTYNPDGDLTSDGNSTYQYDADGHLVKVTQGSTTLSTMTYNALGQQVMRLTPSDNIDLPYDADGRTTGFFNGAGGSWWEQQIWADGQLLGHYDGGTTYFIHRSDVGSSDPTQITNGAGAPAGDEIFYPWGQLWEYDSAVNDGWQFYGSFSRYEDDLGLYLTPNRFYSSSYGRWLTPDPAGMSAANPSNPQTWNLYAYALDNPTTFNDPTGLETIYTCAACTIQITVNGNGDPSDALGELGPGDPMLQAIWDMDSCLMWHNCYQPEISPGGGGAAPAPKPKHIALKAGVFTCASDFAEKYSIAGGLHALGIGTSGVGGFVTNALGGNMFSGATDLYESFRNGSSGGHSVFYNMGQSAMAGPLQGVPGVRGPWGASVSDLATGAIAGACYNGVTGAGETLTTLSGEVGLSLATKSAAEFATGVGVVKFGYDAATYIGGIAGCEAGVIH